jgi:hypothetical protein
VIVKVKSLISQPRARVSLFLSLSLSFSFSLSFSLSLSRRWKRWKRGVSLFRFLSAFIARSGGCFFVALQITRPVVFDIAEAHFLSYFPASNPIPLANSQRWASSSVYLVKLILTRS